ncbi:hypothetical protein TREMEDRAFT_65683 [Tremella mesenterica DSM 1558]|uniref:uncharacterized protein n=1 Tax=Tremella mesenterica (strain ATCC 24925 / CBS 8224 / DSM 1558 / NBRC 9311 / NRRL Y-6157 / RJB 2259-6 / UBC 559-6) TaxID=578456 RepID=UPI00032C5399|nr:uncharacterized protein TREMEDRAFT_65683 [Tremella mesenterica DSM 1558]EIW66396.1 hypothetical protein TREMEDRAFT_65683 [Tremella mesenterica DSM 1558]
MSINRRFLAAALLDRPPSLQWPSAVPLSPRRADQPNQPLSDPSDPSVHKKEIQVDVSDWGIPEHLLSPDAPISSQIPQQQIPDFRTSLEQNVGDERQHGGIKIDQKAQRPQPQLRMMKNSMRLQHIPGGKATPILSPFERNSIHLDQLPTSYDTSTLEHEEIIHETPEDFVSSALDKAARVRLMAENGGVPLPTSPTGTMERLRPTSRLSMNYTDPHPLMIPLPESPMSQMRPLSSMSRNFSPTFHREEEREQVEENPFAIPAPPLELGSRFDPKVLAAQRRSSTSMSNHSSTPIPFPSTSTQQYDNRSSMDLNKMSNIPQDVISQQTGIFSPEEEERRLLDMLRQSKNFDDIPTAEEYGKPLKPSRYSSMPKFPTRHSLLRPKTLILPAPLRGSEPPPKVEKVPEGWTLGEKPLPAQARSSILLGIEHGGWGKKEIRQSMNLEPLFDLSRPMSVGGEGIEGDQVDGVGEMREGGMEEWEGPRKAGKLYGTSLMDQLEARKQAIKGKQRVFTGDSRPSMMSRPSLPSPQSAIPSPSSPNHPPGDRRDSLRPLLQFDSNPNLRSSYVDPGDNRNSLLDPGQRIPKSRSVFGVDQIWEKEMAKLKIMQEEEKGREEAEKARMAALELKRVEGKRSNSQMNITPSKNEMLVPMDDLLNEQQDRTSLLEPLPAEEDNTPGPNAGLVGPNESNLEHSPLDLKIQTGGLVDASFDEGDGAEEDKEDESDDDEEDVPLSKITPRKVQVEEDSSEDGDIPLSRFKSPTKSPIGHGQYIGDQSNSLSPSKGQCFNLPNSQSFTLPTGQLDTPTVQGEDGEDDDVPLLLRKHVLKSCQEDDDIPLGIKRLSNMSPQVFPHFGHSGMAGMSAMSGMPGHMPVMGYSGIPMMGMPIPMMPGMGMGVGMGMPGMSMAGGMPGMNMNMDIGVGGMPMVGVGTPGQAEKAIDEWRKEVAVSPPSVAGSYRLTGDPKWQDRGWSMFCNWMKTAKVNGGVSSVADVTQLPVTHTDNMESFALAETFKYHFLLQSDPDVLSLDDYVLNTEAHPFIATSSLSPGSQNLWDPSTVSDQQIGIRAQGTDAQKWTRFGWLKNSKAPYLLESETRDSDPGTDEGFQAVGGKGRGAMGGKGMGSGGGDPNYRPKPPIVPGRIWNE